MSGNTVPIEPLLHVNERALLGDTAVKDIGRDEGHPRSSTRPRLELVPAALRRGAHSRVGMAAVALGSLVLILAAQLVLSILTSEGAYEIARLQVQQRDLTRVERVLTQHVEKLASPQNLAENAAQLGMVVNSTPSYLRLSDGAILGQLVTNARQAQQNSVPNAELAGLPLVSAEGLLVGRDSLEQGMAKPDAVTQPVRWEGLLPAPKTR